MSKRFYSSLILTDIKPAVIKKLKQSPVVLMMKEAKQFTWLQLLTIGAKAPELKELLSANELWHPIFQKYFPQSAKTQQHSYRQEFLLRLEDAFVQMMVLREVRASLGMALPHEVSNLAVTKSLLDDSDFMQTAIRGEYLAYLCGSHRVRHNKPMLISLIKMNSPVYKVLPESLQKDHEIIKARRGFSSKLAYKSMKGLASVFKPRSARIA